jgi:hypothetical protein
MIEKMAATDQATKGRIVKAVWIPLFEEFGNDYTIIAPDIRAGRKRDTIRIEKRNTS